MPLSNFLSMEKRGVLHLPHPPWHVSPPFYVLGNSDTTPRGGGGRRLGGRGLGRAGGGVEDERVQGLGRGGDSLAKEIRTGQGFGRRGGWLTQHRRRCRLASR